GLTVRRAFRYALNPTIQPSSHPTIRLAASPVEPDVRVETQDTLSLGEDRTVLAANATVEITRAGIFRLSFVMPAGFDVEAISGAALSHWTELPTDAGQRRAAGGLKVKASRHHGDPSNNARGL